jgi:ribonucleotide monophosphatase NagD (HAD superfamily)
MGSVRAVLIDMHGVLTVSWQPLPGAVEALREMRATGLGVALVTNTTSRTRASIAGVLAEAGFPVSAVTAAYLAEHWPGARCALLNSGDIAEDLGACVTVVREDELGDAAPDVVGRRGCRARVDYVALNRAFGLLQRGARLVAMHRNLHRRTDEGLQLGTGAFLVGPEKAAWVEAEITGKPSAAFFEAAPAHVGGGRIRCAGGAAGRGDGGPCQDREVSAGESRICPRWCGS